MSGDVGLAGSLGFLMQFSILASQDWIFQDLSEELENIIASPTCKSFRKLSSDSFSSASLEVRIHTIKGERIHAFRTRLLLLEVL